MGGVWGWSVATDLYLIRHGEAVANVEPIIGGISGDPGLTARGREQARLLRARLRREGLRADALYTSTMPRARETATFVAEALGLAALGDEEWHELRPGEADGLTVAEWEERFGGREFVAGEDPFRPFSPGGESLATFLRRISGALVGLVDRHPDQTVVVVCHGGVLSAVFHHAFGLDHTVGRFHVAPQNTGITHWRHEPAGAGRPAIWTLVTFNDAAHLAVPERGEAEREAVPTPITEAG